MLIHILIAGAVSFFGKKDIVLLQQRRKHMQRYSIK
jgi:hypothetical protein